MNLNYKDDIEKIISHRYDNGYDFWTTKDMKLLKGAPFSTLESMLHLIELGLSKDEKIIKESTNLIFNTLREDGRFKLSPTGGMYPCQTALALKVLCYLGYYNDERLKNTFKYFINSQENDGGWKCNKYSFGRGEETNYSTPHTTLVVLDCLRFSKYFSDKKIVEPAVEFLLKHWEIKKPISPCHYGIGTLFNKVEYPFRGYNIFYYTYVLSFYEYARNDSRFIEAFNKLKSKTIDEEIVVERVVPKLSKLSFCKKGEITKLGTKRFNEIKHNIQK